MASPALRARVEAAERLGISLRRLDGWEPAEVTEYERDETGRIVRSITRREVEWTPDEADLMIALGEVRALACPGCGGHLPETAAGTGEDWTQEPPVRCHRCTALAHARDDYRDSTAPQALHHRVRRLPE